MMMVFCGALAGILLFMAGVVWAYWLLNRGGNKTGDRQKTGGRRGGGPSAKAAMNTERAEEMARQWRELYNFLNYDGGPMPNPGPSAAEKKEENAERRG